MIKIIERLPVIKTIIHLEQQLQRETDKLNHNLTVNGKVLRELPRK